MSICFVSYRCVHRESAALWGLKKCVETINPGLAPWAMQECRPVGAFRRPRLKSMSVRRTYLREYVVLIPVGVRATVVKKNAVTRFNLVTAFLDKTID